jgi:hypothetical protein
MRQLFVCYFFMSCLFSNAQTDSLKKWSFSGYGEFYYSYNSLEPQNHEKASFLYNHKRHNEVNANLLVAKAQYTDKNIRGNLALMAGNYAQYNLSTEPNWAQLVYEANIGVKISKKDNLWLDVGIMPSHIGFESAMGADCWTLTRSLLAENSPYYEAGVKLNYTSKSNKWYVAALALNGWQKIQRPDSIQKPSFGTQVLYKPNDKLVLNYSNFIGSDRPDSWNALRHFHNFYMQYTPTQKWGITAGFDVGSDKYNKQDYGIWYSPVLIIRRNINEKWKAAIRTEYYNDKKQIIISTATENGFQTFGLSTNFDYTINSNALFRFETKYYDSKDVIFNDKNTNYEATFALIYKI